MRDVPTTMTAAWRSGEFVGSRRPVARVTVAHHHVRLRNFTLTSTYRRATLSSSGIASVDPFGTIDPLHGEKIAQTYADFLWSNAHDGNGGDQDPYRPMEIPSVQSVRWDRSVNVDVAECTIVIKNTAPLATGQAPLPLGQFEQPGYYFPFYGGSSFSSRWGHTQNQWFGRLMPDNVIRTFEGYGTDGPDIAPERDEHLVQTGVWLIDDVLPSALGLTMTLKCRDLGRLFLEQKVYTPVIPTQFYPLTFRNWDEKVRIGGVEVRKGRVTAKPTASSNDTWTSNPVAGHALRHAFDGSSSSYWLSIGNSSASARYAYEWVQADAKGNLTEVRFTPVKKNYIAYLSLKVGGQWIGSHTIDYHRDGVGHNGANIHYVKSMVVRSEKEQKFTFPTVKNVQAIRVTFGNLQYFPAPGPYHYRAGIRDVKVFGETRTNTTHDVALRPGPAGANPSRIQDFTDIVKLCAAWAGLFWPSSAARRISDGTTVAVTPADLDTETLGDGVNGAVWGDFESTGTAPPLPLDPSNFDKKSLMDVVAFCRDLIGFYFCIDESGAVQWRMPNYFDLGNVRSGLSATPGRTTEMITIDETQTLKALDVTLTSKNVREGIWAGDTSGRFTTVRPGWSPNPTGMRRLSGWTDYNFASVEEARMAADLIALRQLMEYRKDSVVIPANPAIQCDDQVRVFERTTSEGYVHYVRSISSSNDLESGEWNYSLETNWLGQDPESSWVFTQAQLSEETQMHISTLLAQPYAATSRLEA